VTRWQEDHQPRDVATLYRLKMRGNEAMMSPFLKAGVDPIDEGQQTTTRLLGADLIRRW
jgi:hypothetical protein